MKKLLLQSRAKDNLFKKKKHTHKQKFDFSTVDRINRNLKQTLKKSSRNTMDENIIQYIIKTLKWSVEKIKINYN